MAVLTPNQIAVLIYWVGEFGPQSALQTPTYIDNQGHTQVTIPKPGTPARTRVEKWLDVAIAICLAESHGDTQAKNPSGASGLWQIMMPLHQDLVNKAATVVEGWDKDASAAKGADKAFQGNHLGVTPTQGGATYTVWDARVNTYTAAEVYRAANFKWTPWQTYTDGSYKQYLGHGKAAYAFLTNPSNIEHMKKELDTIIKNDHVIGGIGPISMPSWLAPIFSWLASAGITVGAFLLGAIVVILGIWLIVSKTKAGKAVKSGAKLAALV
jgi:hypothetical protein